MSLTRRQYSVRYGNGARARRMGCPRHRHPHTTDPESQAAWEDGWDYQDKLIKERGPSRQEILNAALAKIRLVGPCKVTHGAPKRTRRQLTAKEKLGRIVDSASEEASRVIHTEQARDGGER